jgi:hypothetical protein
MESSNAFAIKFLCFSGIERLASARIGLLSRRALRRIVRKSQGFIDMLGGLHGDVSPSHPKLPAVAAKKRVC